MIMEDNVAKALAVVRDGGLILYPTDTVWGIGCDATNQEAVRRVFELKKREDSKSLVLLASDMDMVARYVDSIPEMAMQLVEVNDAPMTIIYPGAFTGSGGLAPACVASDGSVGIRIPQSSDFCIRLLSALKRPLVSTSANVSTFPTPESFGSISPDILSGVDFVVDPACQGAATGRSSQIIKVDMDGAIKIIRA